MQRRVTLRFLVVFVRGRAKNQTGSEKEDNCKMQGPEKPKAGRRHKKFQIRAPGTNPYETSQS
jgi:hypothetical protein